VQTRAWTEDLYAVLGVASEADSGQIEARYRALAKLFHPDWNPGDAAAEERFKRITAAYRVLRDPYRRADYDEYRRWSAPRDVPPRTQRPTLKPAPPTRRRRPVPAILRWTVAVTLVLAAVALFVWRVFAPPTDPATEITLWLAGLKLLIVGLVFAAYVPIRDAWYRVSRYG